MKTIKAFLDTPNSGKIAAFIAAVIVMGLLASSSMGQTAVTEQIQPAESKTFFTQFIIAGGPIVWFILGPMSLICSYLAIDACFCLRRKTLLPAKPITSKDDSQISDAQDMVSKAISSAAVFISDKADKARQAAADSLNEQTNHLLRKIEWFSVFGNVAPMVGLLGTVFGMIKAFNLLGISAGQPRPDQLASAISVALITTFWGLLIAIPALTLHGVFKSQIETVVSEAAVEIDSLLEKLKAPGDNITAQKIDAKQKLNEIQKQLNKSSAMKKV